jgi:hypothetical protein
VTDDRLEGDVGGSVVHVVTGSVEWLEAVVA